MSESSQNQANAANNGQQSNRTFTQDELNAIVQERVRESSAKYADYDEIKAKADKFDAAEEKNKTDLQKATDKANALQAKLDQIEAESKIRGIREKIAKEEDIPANLLSGNDEESCKAQAKAIKEYVQKSTGYPNVKDKGESNPGGKGSAKQQFVDWFTKHE